MSDRLARNPRSRCPEWVFIFAGIRDTVLHKKGKPLMLILLIIVLLLVFGGGGGYYLGNPGYDYRYGGGGIGLVLLIVLVLFLLGALRF
jgi:hypothetical protein